MTWVDAFIWGMMAAVVASHVAALVVFCMLAKGNKAREEESYKEGYNKGYADGKKIGESK